MPSILEGKCGVKEMSSEGRYFFYVRRDDESLDSSRDKWKREARHE